MRRHVRHYATNTYAEFLTLNGIHKRTLKRCDILVWYRAEVGLSLRSAGSVYLRGTSRRVEPWFT